MHLILKKYNFYGLIFLILSTLSSCQNRDSEKGEEAKIILVDDLGRKVVLSEKPKKVMALAPSMTEMLFFIGDEEQIVAVTQNCDYPPQAKSKKVVNNYPMDYEALLVAKPDLVFAVEGITPLADAQRMNNMGIPVYYQSYQKVADIFDAMLDIGKILGREEVAQKRVDSLRSIKEKIEKQTESLPKPNVLAITWPDPIYVFGKNTLFTDKLRIAGAVNAVDSVFDAPYPALSREYILKINPDIMIGGTFQKMDSTFFKLYPELKKTKAYQSRRIYEVTDDLNSRPSPRVVESIQELKSLIHPDVVNE